MESKILKDHIDDLTGLKTYESFLTDFERLISESIKNCVDLSLALIDIDDLSAINNEYGHVAGDEMLLSISSYLSANLPMNAKLYRYNGDQFAILFPDTEKEVAYLSVEKLHSCFNENACNRMNMQLEGKVISFSAGVSCCPEDGIKEGNLIRRAHAALFRSKMTGKNKVSLSKVEKFASRKCLYTNEQLHQLSILSKKTGLSDGILLREALDDLLRKYDR